MTIVNRETLPIRQVQPRLQYSETSILNMEHSETRYLKYRFSTGQVHKNERTRRHYIVIRFSFFFVHI